MKRSRHIWIVGLVGTLGLLITPIVIFLPKEPSPTTDPGRYVPVRAPHTDHTALMPGPYASGAEVTRRCLECHENAAEEVMATAHWTWLDDPAPLPGRDQPVAVGKANLLNNFCIGIQSNWTGCTSCHAGYGWVSADFDFSNPLGVDCLVCHDTSGTYVKGDAGYPI